MNYLLAAFLLFAQVTLSYAADSANADDFSAMRAMLAKMAPGTTPDSITPAPIPGLYEVIYGAEIIYATKDGRYMLHGDLLDVPAQKNITEERRTGGRMKALSKLKEDQMIIFAPTKVKHTITVFTDIDCGYCRKMHNEIDSYMKEGIRVRYLSFPRTGVDTPSYDKAVSVWCAKDRKTALTNAKKDDSIVPKTCDNPVKQEMEIGQQVGVTGTPSIITESGHLVPGYVPAPRLAEMLAQDK